MSKLVNEQKPGRIAPYVRKRKKGYPKSFWIELIEGYRRSGLTAKKFCEFSGIGYSTFAKWQRILREETRNSDGKFISVELDKALVAGSEPLPSISEARKVPELKLTINQDLVLSIPKGFDSITLLQVVKALS